MKAVELAAPISGRLFLRKAKAGRVNCRNQAGFNNQLTGSEMPIK
jgi:hypothetical protein